MTPENAAELHARTIAELGVMRILLTCLAKQSPDPAALLADFDQAVEEQRHQMEVRDGVPDERFDRFADLYTRAIAAAGGIPPPAKR